MSSWCHAFATGVGGVERRRSDSGVTSTATLGAIRWLGRSPDRRPGRRHGDLGGTRLVPGLACRHQQVRSCSPRPLRGNRRNLSSPGVPLARAWHCSDGKVATRCRRGSVQGPRGIEERSPRPRRSRRQRGHRVRQVCPAGRWSRRSGPGPLPLGRRLGVDARSFSRRGASRGGGADRACPGRRKWPTGPALLATPQTPLTFGASSSVQVRPQDVRGAARATLHLPCRIGGDGEPAGRSGASSFAADGAAVRGPAHEEPAVRRDLICRTGTKPTASWIA